MSSEIAQQAMTTIMDTITAQDIEIQSLKRKLTILGPIETLDDAMMKRFKDALVAEQQAAAAAAEQAAAAARAAPPAPARPSAIAQYKQKFRDAGLLPDQVCMMHWGDGVYSFVHALHGFYPSNTRDLWVKTAVVLGTSAGCATAPFSSVGIDVMPTTRDNVLHQFNMVFSRANMESLYESDTKLFDSSKNMVMLGFTEYSNTVKLQSAKAILETNGLDATVFGLDAGTRLTVDFLNRDWPTVEDEPSPAPQEVPAVNDAAALLAGFAMGGSSSDAAANVEEIEESVAALGDEAYAQGNNSDAEESEEDDVEDED